MLEQIEDRHRKRPSELLVDGGYLAHGPLDELHDDGTRVYAPLPKAGDGQRPAEEPRDSGSPAVGEWRARMQMLEAKEIYKYRAVTAEIVNADGKAHHDLDRVPIRSI